MTPGCVELNHGGFFPWRVRAACKLSRWLNQPFSVARREHSWLETGGNVKWQIVAVDVARRTAYVERLRRRATTERILERYIEDRPRASSVPRSRSQPGADGKERGIRGKKRRRRRRWTRRDTREEYTTWFLLRSRDVPPASHSFWHAPRHSLFSFSSITDRKTTIRYLW